jgi:hypothetical protein
MYLNNYIRSFRWKSRPSKFYTVNHASHIPKITRRVYFSVSIFELALESDLDFQIRYDSQDGSALIDYMYVVVGVCLKCDQM